MKTNTIEILNDREHILRRPGMYISSMVEEDHIGWIYNKSTNKFEYRQYRLIAGLYKIINEVLDNAIDEALRTNFKFANKIDIAITPDKITISDNGRGVPITNTKDNLGKTISQLELAFTRAKSGSNFSDDNRQTIGCHGIGAFATNVFSNTFEVESRTKDGCGKLVCSGNAKNSSIKIDLNRKSKYTGTSVSFSIDFEKFGVKELSEDHIDLLYTRLIYLSSAYKNIRFRFNGKVIQSSKREDFLKYFGDEFVVCDTKDKNIILGIYPSTEDVFIHSSCINGLIVKDGGSHIDYILREIVAGVRESRQIKKFNISPGDITNKLCISCLFTEFPNAQFNSQTKEKLTNSAGQVKEYLSSINWDKVVKDICRNPAVIEPIIQNYKLKEQLKNKLSLQRSTKLVKNYKCKNYTPSTGDKEYLVLVEGLSAAGGLMPVLGRDKFSFYSTRGVPLNAYVATHKRLADNPEFTDIVKILQLDLANKSPQKLSHNKLVIASDQDADGCFHGDTKIKTVEYGDISFKELVKNGYDKFHVWSIDKDNKEIIAQAHSPRITKTAKKLLKITLDNNETIICTPNHRFLNNSFEYQEARDLKVNQSLCRECSSENNRFGLEESDVLDFVLSYNHKIVSIEEIEETIPVYDISVDKTHNFLLSAGVYVHNSHISGLYLGFIQRYAKWMFDEKRVCKLYTPIATLTKAGKVIKYWITLEDMNRDIENGIPKGCSLNYYKGLGSWNSKDLKDIISENGGIEKFILPIVPDETSDKILDDWIGQDDNQVLARKEYLKNYCLDINKV